MGDGEDDGTSTTAARKISNRGGGKKGKGKGKGGKGKKSCAPAITTTTTTAATEGGEGEVRVDSSHLCFEYHRYVMACCRALHAFGMTTPWFMCVPTLAC